MNAALALLLGLRARAFLRRAGRRLRSPTGAMAAVGAGLVALFLMGPIHPLEFIGQAESHSLARIGPSAVLLLLAMTFFLGSERPIGFDPPEVDFLFPAPLSRRRLLLYRLISDLSVALALASVLAALFLPLSAGFLQGLVGWMMVFTFLQAPLIQRHGLEEREGR